MALWDRPLWTGDGCRPEAESLPQLHQDSALANTDALPSLSALHCTALRRCYAGHCTASFVVADNCSCYCYRYGIGVVKDKRRAFEWCSLGAVRLRTLLRQVCWYCSRVARLLEVVNSNQHSALTFAGNDCAAAA